MRTPTSDIPNSWEMAQLGNVCSKPQYGWTTKAVRTGDNLKLLRTSDISSGRVNWETVPTCVSEPEEPSKYFLSQGDIVVARAGSVGKSFLIREDVRDAVFASYLVRFTPKISPALINLFMQSRRYWSQIEDQSSGIAIPNVNASKLAKLELPIPPLNEQQRIVEKVETLFAQLDKGEEAIRQVQNLLKTYRQSVLKAAVTGELTRDWREANKDKLEPASDLLARILKTRRENWQGRGKYKEPQAPDTKGLPELPEGWVWASVDQATELFSNGLSKKPVTRRTEYPILRISAVRPMLVTMNDLRFYEAREDEDVSKFWVEKDDLLFTRYNGSARYVGVCGLMRDSSQVLHPDKLIKARPVQGAGVDTSYLETAWNCGECRRHIASNIKTTSGQQGIAGSDIKTAPFPLPSLIEQCEIAIRVREALGRVTTMEEWCETELKRSASLRQSILKQAFSGKLVPQDPDDEPASVLLERIKAERDASKPVVKRTSKKSAKQKVKA